MRASVFVHEETNEPIVVDLNVSAGLEEDDGQATVREIVGDATQADVEELHIVSEQALNVAVHALHGALRALDGGPGYARDWITAGLRELAFYDQYGIEVEGEFGEKIDGHEGPRAADPGRAGLAGYVDWPDAPAAEGTQR